MDNNRSQIRSFQSTMMKFGFGLALLWLLIIMGSLWRDVTEYAASVEALAATEARSSLNKDISYRRWAASHGGVYAPVTEASPPNRYLTRVEERDVTTPTGKALTLINPAYMSRQVFDIADSQYEVKGHITSLKPIRPENGPDEWEKQALIAFQNGTDEVQEKVDIDGEEFLRVMRPLYVEPSCMKCHGYQNYKIGDIRGGLSVSVPMKAYNSIKADHFTSDIFGYAVMLLLGFGGISLTFAWLGKMEKSRQRAQMELEKSENHLRAVFEGAKNVAFVTTDLNGEKSVILEFSPGAEQIFGYRADEVIGKEVRILHASGDTSGFGEKMTDLLKTGGGFSEEVLLRRKSGEVFSGLLTINPFRDASGDVVGTVGVTLDISRRKKAEEALRESEETARALLNANNEAAFLIELDGTYVIMNEVTAKRIGGSVQELVGRNCYEFLSEELATKRKEKIREVVATGQGVRFVEDREHYILNQSAHPIFGADGKVCRIAIFGQDITNQKVAEETLNKDLELNRRIADISKEFLAELYDLDAVAEVALSAVLSVTDSEHGFVSSIDRVTHDNVVHTVTEMYEAGRRLSGKKLRFPIGKDGIYPGLWGCVLNSREPMFTNDPMNHSSSKGLPREHLPLRNYLAVPVLIGDNLLGMIAIANASRDYTEQDIFAVQRIAEIFALALHRQDYETQKQEMDQRMRQLQKNEAIGSLAGGIAHDFNNILTPILGYSEYLKDDLPNDSPVWDTVNQISLAANRAKDLVKQILTFSRQHEQEVAQLKPHLVLKEVVKLIKSTIPSTIEVKDNIDPDCLSIMADPTQIHQVAMNLLTNAYHAMQDEGGVLTISLQNEEVFDQEGGLELAPGPYVVLTVEDTGGGIDEESLEKIFNPYYSTKPLGKGTGLGLSVVYGIVKNYKGDIEVESTVGVGTRFKIYIPAMEQEQVVVDPRLMEQLELAGSEKILLVDDEAMILDMEQRLLTRYGYQVEALGSSREALDILSADPSAWDLLITDMTMPGITGDNLTKEVRKVTDTLGIIICTGFSETMSAERAKEIGADGLLMKPVGGTEMARMVRDVLDAKKTGEPS